MTRHDTLGTVAAALFATLLLINACNGSSTPSGDDTADGSQSGSDAGSSGGSDAGSPDASSGGSDAGSDAGSADGSTAAPLESARVACVDRINEYRRQAGVAPVTRWTEAESCVDSEAASDGASSSAHGSFGRCGEFAQNECPGYPSLNSVVTTCLQQMYAEGPGTPYSAHGHYINMTNASYTRVACGFAQLSNGKWWAAQDFK